MKIRLSLVVIFSVTVSILFGVGPSLASHTPDPASVTVAGSLQSELGCPVDWDPACSTTHLEYDTGADVWQKVFTVPAGEYEYKAALNDSWDENYGANAVTGGANIKLNLAASKSVKFYYDHKSHWVTDNVSSRIVTAPGSYQSELGCSGDWQPDCLRSWLQDSDGDGIFQFSTQDIPAGSYEFKAAINESWDENYGLNGGSANVPFIVPGPGFRVTFYFQSATNTPSVTVISTGPKPDNNIEWDGLRHDSRDPLYRTPGGAVPAGTPIKLRFRTYHNDVTGIKVRVYDINTSSQQLLPMQLAAEDVGCYQAGLPYSCDFWEVTLTYGSSTNLWYRFIIQDGSDINYYADNTPALDGGLGSTSDVPVDNSYALMVYDPAFSAPEWVNGASLYQIFPDRFRNGRSNNDPKTGDSRYDDPIIKLPWGTLPEGYCRNYADGNTNCPWRFDATPPVYSPTKEQPRGRDYMGGDLKGVDQYLDYLQSLGVNTLYFNPIFDSVSNHGYDTQDYYNIDPYFGTQKDWENLVKHTEQRGMRIILDGVFNHMSSDSPLFDRYHHYLQDGACESVNSPYRAWFYFHDVPAGTGTCVGSTGQPKSATYDGWFGFDSIPVINKSLPEVQTYFLTGANSVSRYWLDQGASGWRMDVMGDASFPAGYWETFRGVVKDTQPDALIISETWQKDSTLLSMLRGDRADTTMNYRLRDAILGLLAPGPFDSKGFADSGHMILVSEFAARLESIREDYPDAAYYSLMNLLDSHDTERIRWTLTPGLEMTAEKELDPANVAEGKQRQRIASLIQFTVPGIPTVYYGDEVGMTGDDDPDDRRTYPWLDKGGQPDQAMFQHYQKLNALRAANDALVHGDFQVLLADDASQVVAFGRKTGSQAAIVIVNRSDQFQSGAIPVASYLPDGIVFKQAYAVGIGGPGSIPVENGEIAGSLGPLSAVVLVTGPVDLLSPDAPANLTVLVEGSTSVNLSWDPVQGAVGYNIYRSPVSGGGWVQVGKGLADTSYNDSGLVNGKIFYYVVTASDLPGNESGYSNEVSALPHYTIGWANLQWPPSLEHTISPTNRTGIAYGQVWIDFVTSQPGAAPTLRAQLGYGPEGSNPDGNPAWMWVDAGFNVDVGNNDEFKASLLPEAVGIYDYVYRYSTTDGRDWLYADLNGPVQSGNLPLNPGKLTVNSTGDLISPTNPTGLIVTGASPAAISLGWDPHPNTDVDLAGFEVYRDGALLARLIGASLKAFTDESVSEGMTYTYTLVAIDTSFNRSDPSDAVIATAEPRTVSLTFNVTVPATTDATGLGVYIAGFLDRLDGVLPQWDPGGVILAQVDPTHWTITLTGKEAIQIEYKYALGSWDYVEKGASCDEIGNRMLTLSYGTNGIQIVNDTVLNWRNVAPCGN